MRECINRSFKGVWIPKEIYLDDKLSWTEKILFIEIDSLDKEGQCFCSNEYFASFLGVKERAVSGMISKLKNLGYIRQESFDGRKRFLRSNARYCYSDSKISAVQTSTFLQPCNAENCDHINTVNNTGINSSINNIPQTPNGVVDGGSEQNKIVEEMFEVFYRAFPRHQGKAKALSAFKKIKPDQPLFEKMMRAVEQQRNTEQWTKEKGKYVPMPATWLNGKRWEDEVKEEEIVKGVSTNGYSANKGNSGEDGYYDGIKDIGLQL